MTVGNRIRNLLVVLLAAFFIAVPIYSFLYKGPFSWHVKQPQAWQGGAEVLALIALIYTALSLPAKRVRIGLALLFAWLYARHQGVDLSIILLYVYAEALLALGWIFLPRIGLPRVPRPSHLLVAGLVGVILWSLVIWTSSALGVGSPNAIRLIAACVLGLAIVFGRGPRLGLVLARAVLGKDHLERLFVALIAGFFLALFAKASVVVDYDSLWYGLQGEKVLVGDGSLYAGQGLVSVVHYYPKLYEALQLPFAGVGSISLLFGLGIFSWLMIVLTASAILREFKVRRWGRISAAALVATLPAVANIAVTAKGDAFSAWLMMLAVLALVRFRKGLGGVWFWIALCSLPLAVMARLSNLPYAAVVSLLLGISLVQQSRRAQDASAVANRGLRLGVATALLLFMVTARTIILAGVPLIAPNAVVRLEQSLGFVLKYPAGLLPDAEGVPEFPWASGMWRFLFDPASLPHIIITWPGNVWIFLPIAGLFLASKRLRYPGSWLLLVIGACFFAVLFGYKHVVAGGDGNYFIFPIICLTLWGFIQAAPASRDSRAMLAVLALVFSSTAASISFVTGSWGPGTRAFDFSLLRMPFEFSLRASQGIAAAHLQGIDRYFQPLSPGTRVVGLELADLNAALPAGWWLPVRYEPLQAYAWQQPELVRSSVGIQEYLRRAEIEYVIAPKGNVGGAVQPLVMSALTTLQASGSAETVYQDGFYSLWKLKAVYSTTIALDGGGTAKIEIPIAEVCEGPNATGMVSWSAPLPIIAIEVGSEQSTTKSLWTESTGQGNQATGPWVSVGAEFIFRRGRNGEIVGRLRVTPTCPR